MVACVATRMQSLFYKIPSPILLEANQTSTETINCKNILTRVLGNFSPKTSEWSLPEGRLPTLVKFRKREVQVLIFKRELVVT